MEVIKYKRTWCDYLTPCPYLNKENNPEGIMVGDYDCYNCPYNITDIDNHTVVEGHHELNKGKIVCSYKEKHQNEKENVRSSISMFTNCNTFIVQ